jgi:hypothetical protein
MILMKMSQQLKNTGSLLDATEALGNWRALALFAASLLGAALVFGVLAMTQSGFGLFLGALLSWLVAFYGVNAVGIMLMDASRSGQSRQMAAAVMASLFSSHRLLLVGLVALGGMLLLLLLVAIVLLLCKIPLLGPLLFTFVLPLSALLLGFAFFALAYVFYPLAASAVWSGASVRETLVNLLAIARQRLVSVVVKELVLALVVLVSAGIIGGIVFSGLGMVMSMSAGILGGIGGLGMQSMAMMAMGGMGEGGGYVIAGGLGSSLLLAAAMIVPGLIALQGCCQIYLSSIDGLDVSATEQELARRQQQLEQKTQQIKQKIEEQKQQLATPAPVAAANTAMALPHCPHCKALLEDADDRFCGECGKPVKDD